jgi:hypothetical protein
MDETGFRIGVLNGKIVIIYLNTKAVYLADSDNRESLTVIETVSAGGEAIVLFLILKGEILLEEHFNNDLDTESVFATSSTGYTNDVLSLKYIKYFHNQIYRHIQGKWRMLIFDGYGSYTSDEFLYYYWSHKIVPFQLLLYSIYLL